MKDLILITAYCPDKEKIERLRSLVNFLNTHEDHFDLMIVSHTVIPLDIQEKVNLVLYDSKNELLTDWDLVNQPWFNPGNDRRIQSGLLSGRNTHLAIWRMLILGFSVVKNIGYKKVHHIEYDTELSNIDDFKENSELLEIYDTIYYKDKKGESVDEILFGSFQSYKVSKIHKTLIDLDEDLIKDMIRNARTKSPEKMLENLIHEVGNFLVKSKHDLDDNGNFFGVSDNDKKKFISWGVPFVDILDNKFKFIIWNTDKKEGVTHNIIVNDENMFSSNNLPLDHWKMITLGDYDSVNKIITIEDNEVRDVFVFNNDYEKELFKKSSYRWNDAF